MHAFTFTLTVYDEPDAQVEWCLSRLRQCHPDAPVTVVCDGGRDYSAVAERHWCRYVDGEHLKALPKGALWWERFFAESLRAGTEVLFKIDADTMFHRPFAAGLPVADFFGSVVTHPDGVRYVQGGIQGFSRSAAGRALSSGHLRDPAYQDPATWAFSKGFLADCARTGYLSTDWTIRHVFGRLGIEGQDWPEVHSRYRELASNPGRRHAVTHPRKLSDGPRFAVATLYTPEMREVGELAARNRAAYCDRHGYDLVVATRSLDAARPPSWSKVLLLEKYLPDYDWVMWSDADSLVLNPSVRLEDLADDAYELVISADTNGVSCGQFLVRNVPRTFEFLRRVYAQEQFVNHMWWEQAAVQHLLRAGEAGIRHKLVPQRAINAYPNSYKPGDFVLHFPGRVDKLGLMRRHADRDRYHVPA